MIALIYLERFEEAEEALETAKIVVENTEEEVSELLRGRLCVANGKFAFENKESERAEELYDGCLEAYPSNQLVVLETVSFYDRLNRSEEATNILRDAFEETQNRAFGVAGSGFHRTMLRCLLAGWL